MRALVSGMMTPVGLFAVRRLWEMGFEVTAVGTRRLDYSMYSRAVRRRLVFPSPRYKPMEFARAILEELARGGYDLYLPTFEDGFLMSFFQDEIKKYARFQMMPFDAITAVHDKGRMAQIARAAGVPIPEPTFQPASLASVAELAAAIDFPVLVKIRNGSNAHGQKFVRDPAALPGIYAEVAREYGLDEPELPIIQRHLSGPLVFTVSLAREGKVLGTVVFEALRVYPRSGGTSSLRMVIRHREAEEFDRRLIEHLNWTGFFCADYMREEATGRLALIDINPRPAPGIILAYHAGSDLFGAYVDMVLGRPIRSLAPPRPGTMGKMHFLEIGAALEALFDRGLGLRERFALWRSVLGAAGCPDDVFSWRDLRPFLALWAFILPRVPQLLGAHGGEVFLEKVLFDGARFARALEGQPAVLNRFGLDPVEGR